MPDTPRPVWLTPEEVNTQFGIVELARLVRDRWDAAPADPAEAVREAMLPIQHHTYDYDEETAAVLRALGAPDA